MAFPSFKPFASTSILIDKIIFNFSFAFPFCPYHDQVGNLTFSRLYQPLPYLSPS
jgi:hypothetical protein